MSALMDPAAQAAMAAAIEAATRAFNIQLWTLYAFGVLATVLRTYARVKTVGLRELRLDDALVWIAILIYSTQSTLAYFAVNYGQGMANNSMTDVERATLDPTSQEYHLRVFGSQVQVIGWTTYVFLIGTLKMAMLVFYIRLMEGLSNRYRMRIWVGFGLVGATWVASTLTIYTACRPFHKYWQINPDPGNSCQAAVGRPIVWVTFISSVVTDLYLIMVPLPMLWGTKLRLPKKIAATFVLGAGIFVLICSLLKTVFVETDPVHGAQLAGEWGTREAFVSVVTTNLPMLFPLIKSWIGHLFGSAFNSTSAASKHPSGFQTIGGGNGESTGAGRRRQANTLESHVTAGSLHSGDSQEQIILQKMRGPEDGILVSSEFEVRQHNDERERGQIQKPWEQ